MQKIADLYFVDGCGRCSLYATPACKVHTWAEELQAPSGHHAQRWTHRNHEMGLSLLRKPSQ